MNLNVLWVGFVRMCLFMCCLAIFIVLISLTGSGLGLVFVLTLPYSLIPLCGISALLSGLTTAKHRVWMSSRLDKWLLGCGAAVLLWILGVIIYETYREIQNAQRRAAIEAKIAALKPAATVAPKQWTARSWTGVMPDCLRLKDSEIENQCPGRVSLTYCWRMDNAKEWNAKEADCELDQKKQRIFATGTTTLQVPWCRSYHETCLAELKPLHARAIDN